MWKITDAPGSSSFINKRDVAYLLTRNSSIGILPSNLTLYFTRFFSMQDPYSSGDIKTTLYIYTHTCYGVCFNNQWKMTLDTKSTPPNICTVQSIHDTADTDLAILTCSQTGHRQRRQSLVHCKNKACPRTEWMKLATGPNTPIHHVAEVVHQGS